MDYSIVAEKRLAHLIKFDEPEGNLDELKGVKTFEGRVLIKRDTPINKGVYLGGSPREESVVVDDEKYPLLREKYNELLEKIDGDEAKWPKRLFERLRTPVPKTEDVALQQIFDFVNTNMQYNNQQVEYVRKAYGDSKKVSLDMYVGMKAGVCKHQSLFSAYLAEQLIEDGRLGGHISIDRNSIKGRGGHAWARYTENNDDKTVWIIDVAQGYMGKLEDVDPENRWFYKRPEDQ